MKFIVLILAIVCTPFTLLWVVDRCGLWPNDSGWRGRVSLSFFFIFTGVAHFVWTEPMSRMLPPFVPLRSEIILLTGLLEIAGAIGLWWPRTSRLAALCLLVFLAAVFPANIYAALQRIPIGGHDEGWKYLAVRTPAQIFLMVWVWYFGLQRNPGRPQTV